MIAYKFLEKGAKSHFSGYAWPTPRNGEPGAWVEVEGPLSLGRCGLHLCRSCDLAHWLHDELWEIESDGEQAEGLDCIIVRRARLVRPIEAWSQGGAARFVDAAIEHAAAMVASNARQEATQLIEEAKQAASAGYFAVGAFSAALAVGKTYAAAECEQAYRVERLWQAEWIAREMLAT